MLRIYNITDVTHGRGRRLQLFQNMVAARKHISISEATYRKYAKKLDRLVAAGDIFIGNVLPPHITKARQRARKPLVVAPPPEPKKPSKLSQAVKEMVSGGSPDKVQELVKTHGARQRVLATEYDQVTKKRINAALMKLGLDTDGNKRKTYDSLMDAVCCMELHEDTVLAIEEILFSEE